VNVCRANSVCKLWYRLCWEPIIWKTLATSKGWALPAPGIQTNKIKNEDEELQNKSQVETKQNNTFDWKKWYKSEVHNRVSFDLSCIDHLRETEILIDENDRNFNLRGATISGFLFLLLQPQQQNPAFQTKFLTTYDGFISSQDLLEQLIQRFEELCPTGSSEYDVVCRRFRTLRLLAFLKCWMRMRPEVFFHSDSDHVYSLAIGIIQKYGGRLSKIHLAAFFSEKEKYNKSRKAEVALNTELELCTQGYTLNVDILLDWDSKDLAEQLTLMEWKLFSQISPQDFIRQLRSPSLQRFTKWFNQISRFFMHTILSAEKKKKRVRVIQHLIDVMQHLQRLNNFNGIMEIVCALQSSSVCRLKKTWKALPADYALLHETFTKLVSRDRGFQRYRRTLQEVEPPCIPYLGITKVTKSKILFYYCLGNPSDNMHRNCIDRYHIHPRGLERHQR
jgi:hypothetical protein